MRLERGIKTQAELAAQLSYPATRRVVAAWERDEYPPGVMHMGALSDLLRVSQQYLLKGEDPETGESEFIARMRGLEQDGLDERAKRMLLSLAAQQVREIKEARELLTDRQRQAMEKIDDA
jgi:hypothetical protein